MMMMQHPIIKMVDIDRKRQHRQQRQKHYVQQQEVWFPHETIQRRRRTSQSSLQSSILPIPQLDHKHDIIIVLDYANTADTAFTPHLALSSGLLVNIMYCCRLQDDVALDDDDANLKLISTQSQGEQQEESALQEVSAEISMDDINKSIANNDEEGETNKRYLKRRRLHFKRKQQKQQQQVVKSILSMTSSVQKPSPPRAPPRVMQILLVAQRYNNFLLWMALCRGGRNNDNPESSSSSAAAADAILVQETANNPATVVALDQVNSRQEEDPHAASHTHSSAMSRTNSSSPSSGVVVQFSSSFSSATVAAPPNANTEVVSSSEVVTVTAPAAAAVAASPPPRPPVFRERPSPKTKRGKESSQPESSSSSSSSSWQEKWSKQADRIQELLDLADQEEDEYWSTMNASNNNNGIALQTAIRGIKAPPPIGVVIATAPAKKTMYQYYSPDVVDSGNKNDKKGEEYYNTSSLECHKPNRTRRIMSLLVVDEVQDSLENALLLNGYYTILKKKRDNIDNDNDAVESVISVLTNDDRRDIGIRRRRRRRSRALVPPRPLRLDFASSSAPATGTGRVQPKLVAV